MVQLAWRNIQTNWVRSLLNVAAVALGVAVTIDGSMIVNSVREGILQSDEIRLVMEGLIEMLDPGMLFVSVVVILAAGFLIFNTFGMAITQRRQQIGSLRTLGMTQGQVLRLILAEALVLAVAGVILGVLVSIPLGHALIAFMRRLAGTMLNFGDASPEPIVVIFAVVMGLSATLLSVLIPAQRAARIGPLDALREPDAAGVEPLSRWQPLIGSGLIIGVLLIDVIAPPGTWATYPVDLALTLLFVLAWLAGVILLLPGIIGWTARRGQILLPGATGRIVCDNLSRARGRVTLTVMTLAFALLTLIGLTGFLEFYLVHGFGATMENAKDRNALFMSRLEMTGGWGTIVTRNLDSIMMADDEVQAVLETVEGRANTATLYLAVVPEISVLGRNFYSYVVDPAMLHSTGDTVFSFTEGDWETALPIMEGGCGLLVAPSVAGRLGAGVGDTITVTALDGPLDCVIAGTGASVAGASIISDTLREHFTRLNPMMIFVVPFADGVVADLEALRTDYPEINLNIMSTFLEVLDDSVSIINLSLSAMLVLATFAAAFSVVNTIMIGVDERRREIALLRAVGTTRSQTVRIIVGESILMGIIGGGIGFLAGLGAVVVIVTTYGFSSFGVSLNLWQAAWASMQPALVIGVIGLIAAPVIAALAAWFPAKRVLSTPLHATT